MELIVKRSLVAEVFTIGYKNEGESIVILIEVDGNIVYSCIVDSYELEKQNAAKEILNERGIKRVDQIFWTHPHNDHTKGMKEIIETYADPNTIIAYPVYLLGLSWDSRDGEDKEIMKYIEATQKNKKDYLKLPKMKPVSDGQILYKKRFRFLDKSHKFNLMALTPDSSRVERKMLLTDEKQINDFSISLLLQFGQANILLAGDILNGSINAIYRELLPERIDYLKAPHHGSDGSDSIFCLTDNMIDIANITEFANCSLPSEKSKKLYKANCNNVYVFKDDKSEDNYGYTKTTYDLIYKKCLVEKYGRVNKI